jgi:hypothetical protein
MSGQYSVEERVWVINTLLHAEDAVSHSFLADTHCKLSSSMSPGAGRAAAREIKQADPQRRRVRDILEMNVIGDVVIEEEQERVSLTYICI